MVDTRKFIDEWQRLASLEARETYIKNHLIRLYLNVERRAFLQEFTAQFDGVERLKILKLCRKILVQYPERIIDVDKGHFEAFKEEYLLEINNDIPIDGIKWIDEELNYLEFDLSLKTETTNFDNSEAQTSKTAISSKNSSVTTMMSKEETLTYFRISSSTFDRWRKRGFRCEQVGKKFFVDKSTAEDWIAKNKPTKIVFSRQSSRSQRVSI